MSRAIASRRVPLQYSQGAFPALKFFLPMDETSGTTVTDHAGGIVCDVSLADYNGNPIADMTTIHATANAVSADAITLSATGEVNLNLAPRTPLPAPNGKVAILLSVWGPLPYDNGATDFGYIRFGAPESPTNPEMFVVSQNSKDAAGNNCFKSLNGDPGIGLHWVPKINTPQAMATVIEYVSASSVRNDYWVDNTKVTALSTSTVHPFTALGAGIGISADGAAKTSIYTLQWWFFDVKPTDAEMAAACLWTRDKAIAGIKAPFPGWVGRT